MTTLKKPSQCARLLKWLKAHPASGITIFQAFIELGITNPHKRVSELESDGHAIARSWLRLPCGTRVRRYRLA